MASAAKEDISSAISALYAELQRCGDSQSYEKALKVSDQILKLASSEKEAFHAKAVCLIQLNEFDRALGHLESDSSLASGLIFETAYCQYRLNKNEAALKTLQLASPAELRCKELKAQLLYRLEDYTSAMALYQEVIKNSQDDYDDERQTNMSAVHAALSLFTDNTPDDTEFDEGCYERCYNAACYLIGQKDYRKAEDKLKLAEELCRKSLEEEGDMTEEEKEDELSLIRVQLAYCAQKLGLVQDALKVYNAVLKNKPSDIAVAAVAANNAVVLNKDQNVFDSKKKMKLATVPDLAKKLTSSQLQTIDVNSCLLHYLSNQVDACRSQCSSLQEKYPSNAKPVLIEASLLSKARQHQKASEMLQSYVSKVVNTPLEVRLTLAQLYLSQDNIKQACAVLRALGPSTFRPAIVSLLISLYLSKDDKISITELFDEVVSWYEKNEADSPCFRDILKASADFQMKHKNPKMAAQLFEKLRRVSPGDVGVISSLFAAYSQFDPVKAKIVSNELPSVESLAANIDVDQLESAAFNTSKYKMKKDEKTPVTVITWADEQQVKKHKRKRKGKLPKNFNPNVDPDPERWLPKKERSTYRGRRKDKRKDGVGKGSQGATSTSGPELDVAKMEPVSSASESSSAHPVPSSNSKGYSASKQQQKKKKRSGKK